MTLPIFTAEQQPANHTTERDREVIALKAHSPKRSTAPQEDVDGLALFDTYRAPRLL